ncbi:hypothetical protein TBK1r_10880 [Stieleria magnilauensis]|uniref:Uncharacterized protein n=1 Tax=Stieleria magnilauensis TaxID=2527963 RepID=A0ABX5XJJ7_9BACT|nr:hypothetical protein TBK1r_10880 [Planctomycetes bacterium TBK1r]
MTLYGGKSDITRGIVASSVQMTNRLYNAIQNETNSMSMKTNRMLILLRTIFVKEAAEAFGCGNAETLGKFRYGNNRNIN